MNKNIQMSPVKSSQIAEIGHSGDTLAVKFKNGTTYHYSDVSPEQFSAFQGAESIGNHFGAHFKKNEKHPFTKIPQD